VNLAHVPGARALALIVLPLVILAACSDDIAATATRAPLLTGAGPTATVEPPTSFGPPPSPTPPDDATPIELDATLLGYLPESVAGIDVVEDVDEAAKALSDPTLPRIASAVDAAVAVDTGNGNLVFAWIVRLRAGVFTEADYRQWRDSYDDGACAGSGGVVGHAEATIAGRQTFITSCVASLRTYHVWLKDEDILVSASSIGDGAFGEKLLEGLRVPS
jgi:hypothetical protein